MSLLTTNDSNTQSKPNFKNLNITCLSIGKKLEHFEYDIPCIDLAKMLLGKVLVRKMGTNVIKGKIIETECYPGKCDKASHSFNGRKTDRNQPMFMAPGTTYVYFTYGMYHCFNISSRGEGAAVLLRAIEPLEGIELMKSHRRNFRRSHKDITSKKNRDGKEFKIHELCNGPSKLCISFSIDKECNMQDLGTWDRMWIEHGEQSDQLFTVVQCPRIGIDSAGQEAASKDLRFYILGNSAVSKRNKNKEKEQIPQIRRLSSD